MNKYDWSKYGEYTKQIGAYMLTMWGTVWEDRATIVNELWASFKTIALFPVVLLLPFFFWLAPLLGVLGVYAVKKSADAEDAARQKLWEARNRLHKFPEEDE